MADCRERQSFTNEKELLNPEVDSQNMFMFFLCDFSRKIKNKLKVNDIINFFLYRIHRPAANYS